MNNVIMDSCKKCAVVFDNVVAMCEFINCQSVQMQVKETVRSYYRRNTVGLGTMAQHARLWVLPMAKLVGQSKIASNIPWGKFNGLHHVQSSLLYNKNCSLQTSKHSFFRPYLKGLSRLVRRPKPQNSAVSQPIRMRFGVSMHLW